MEMQDPRISVHVYDRTGFLIQADSWIMGNSFDQFHEITIDPMIHAMVNSASNVNGTMTIKSSAFIVKERCETRQIFKEVNLNDSSTITFDNAINAVKNVFGTPREMEEFYLSKSGYLGKRKFNQEGVQ